MAYELDDLVDWFHEGDFSKIISALGDVQLSSLSSEEAYFLGVSLIRSDQQLTQAIELLNQAEADGYSSQWLDYWRCHGYIKTGDLMTAAKGASALICSDINFKPAFRMLFNLITQLTEQKTEDHNGAAIANLILPLLIKMENSQPREPLDKEDERFAFNQIQLDVLQILVPQAISAAPFHLTTDHPIAVESDDTRSPRGAMSDNSRSPRFVAACERLFGQHVRHMDLGCAGGGLVYDFLARGHQSVGLEGSDYGLKAQAGFWRVIPNYLKTCDITQPFDVWTYEGSLAAFDIISAWEVLEHIQENDIEPLLENIRKHLAPNGMFVASVAQFPDYDPQTKRRWHVTLRSKNWWANLCRTKGFTVLEQPPFEVLDFVRGVGRYGDWDVRDNPHRGFHLVLRKNDS